MGYQVILDLVGSIIIGGALLLTLIGFSADNRQAKQEYVAAMVSQENIISVSDALESDLKQIGYCKSKTAMISPVIVSAGADSISFRTDIPTGASPEGDGIVDVITYKVDRVSRTGSSGQRLLRKVNSGQLSPFSSGMMQFDIRYYKSNGDTLSRPVASAQLREIARVEVTVGMGDLPFSNTGSPSKVGAGVKTLRCELRNFGIVAIP